MQTHGYISSISTLVLALFLWSPLSAQMGDDLLDGTDGKNGPVGGVDDETDEPDPADDAAPVAPGAEAFAPYPGPLGRVDDRLPHGACATCFTVPGLGDGRYQIFERLDVNGEEVLIQRMIPNPSPAIVNEAVEEERDEETGERIWYIGDQGFVGPTDEERWAATAPLSTIALKRIQMRHLSSIMSITGVHQFGIGTTGFVVGLHPEHALNTDRIPLSLDGVPVTVELIDPIQAAAHDTTRLRPVPSGAGIGVPVARVSGTRWYMHYGTLGPHVVRNASDVGTCCQVWGLTAGHTVKDYPHSSNPTPGTRAVYQPVNTLSASARIGYVAHVFRLWTCSTVTDPFCWRESTRQNPVPINSTLTRPDIAAIDYLPYGDFQPPWDADAITPVRHLQYSATAYHDGPAGKIFEARRRHRHQMWGSRTPGGAVGRVAAVNMVANIIMGRGNAYTYRMCCLNRLNLNGQGADSGALVAYASSRDYKRYVAGVMIAVNTTPSGSPLPGVWYVPASDIQTAFRNARKSFHHYWGTRRGYREPSLQATDD